MYIYLKMGSYIKYGRKIYRKTNAHVRVRIRGLEMLVFLKILRTYLMDGPNFLLYVLPEPQVCFEALSFDFIS